MGECLGLGRAGVWAGLWTGIKSKEGEEGGVEDK